MLPLKYAGGQYLAKEHFNRDGDASTLSDCNVRYLTRYHRVTLVIAVTSRP